MPARLLPALVALVAFAVYVRTMLPGVGIWDTAEFQTVPRILGIMHATGYPLYTLVGWLVSWLPVGDVAYRLNLFSGACAAVAAGLVALAARRLGAGPGPAVAAGLLFALFGPTWETALRADPHTLHAAFAAGLLLALLAWRDAPTPARLAGLAGLAGLALANHMQATLLLPALAVGAAWGRLGPLLKPRALGAAAGGLALGLLPFLYLPLRARMHPALNYGRPEDWPRFRALVLGEHFQQDMGLFTAKGLGTLAVQLGRLPDVIAGWWAPGVLAVVGVAAIAGLVALARRDRGAAAALAVMLALPLAWACTWINGDPDRYFVVPALALVVPAAVGAEAGLAWLGARRALVARGLAAGVAIAPLALVPLHLADRDRSRDRDGARYAEAVFAQLPPRAAVFTVWVNSTPLWYAQHVEGKRPDVRIVDDSEVVLDYGSSLDGAIDAALRERPVYVLHPAGDVASLGERFLVRDHGPVPVFSYPALEIVKRR